jgi:exonuclease VII large subunit
MSGCLVANHAYQFNRSVAQKCTQQQLLVIYAYIGIDMRCRHTSDETFADLIADVIADDRMDTPTRAAVELARIKTKRGLFG